MSKRNLTVFHVILAQWKIPGKQKNMFINIGISPRKLATVMVDPNGTTSVNRFYANKRYLNNRCFLLVISV